MRITQSEEELKNHLKEQIRFIQKSSKEFDNGDISEARRIATHIRVLVHDPENPKSNSKSLLLIIGDKNKILFLNSALLFHPNNLMPYMGLVSIRVVDDEKVFRANYKPLLGSYLQVGGSEKWVKFDEWWNGFIIKDQSGNFFTRKDLVLHIAETDGGAHVDPALCQNYVALSRNNSIGFFTAEKRAGETTEQINTVRDIELASIRQIAFEVELSLMRFYQLDLSTTAC